MKTQASQLILKEVEGLDILVSLLKLPEDRAINKCKMDFWLSASDILENDLAQTEVPQAICNRLLKDGAFNDTWKRFVNFFGYPSESNMINALNQCVGVKAEHIFFGMHLDVKNNKDNRAEMLKFLQKLPQM